MLFADHVNPRLVKWRQSRAPGWLWGPDMAPAVGARLSIGLVVEYWRFVGACTRHSYSTLNSTICVFFLL